MALNLYQSNVSVRSNRDKDQLTERVEDQLDAWRDLIHRTLRSTKYKSYAEDVAQEMVLRLIRRTRRGGAVPDCPKSLLGKYKQEVFRIAYGMTAGGHDVEVGWSAIPDPKPRDDDDAIGNDPLKLLEPFFTEPERAAILKKIRSGDYGKREWANAAGMSERTFRYKVTR